MSETEDWHGTWGGYTNHGCHCAACTAANTEGVKEWAAKPKKPPASATDYQRYKYYGMRDPEARAANAERRREQRARRSTTKT